MTPDDLIYEYYSQNKLMRAIESVYILINYDKYKWEEGKKMYGQKIPIQHL